MTTQVCLQSPPTKTSLLQLRGADFEAKFARATSSFTRGLGSIFLTPDPDEAKRASRPSEQTLASSAPKLVDVVPRAEPFNSSSKFQTSLLRSWKMQLDTKCFFTLVLGLSSPFGSRPRLLEVVKPTRKAVGGVGVAKGLTLLGTHSQAAALSGTAQRRRCVWCCVCFVAGAP